MELFTGIFTAFGLSASAGLNAYIPLLAVGLIAHYAPQILSLTNPWNTLASPWIILMLCVLVIIEMLADKAPVVNHINDLIQTVIRPAAGAIAFAASSNAATNVHPVLALACGLLVAGAVHMTKSAVVRPILTAATGGVANTPVSIAEDAISTVVSLLAILVPVIIGTLIVVAVAFIIYWLYKRSNAAA